MKPFRAALVGVCLFSLLSACTSAQSSKDTTLHSTSSGAGITSAIDASSSRGTVAPNPTITTRPIAPPDRVVTITCTEGRNSAGTVPPGPEALSIGNVTFDGLGSKVSTIPMAADVGVKLPHSTSLHFRKTPVQISATRTRVVLSISAGNQYLALVPASIWTGNGGGDVSVWLTKTLVVQGCSDSKTYLFGGIVSGTSRGCFTLSVAVGDKKSSVALRLDGSRC